MRRPLAGLFARVLTAAVIASVLWPNALAAQVPERDRLLNCFYGARTQDPAAARNCLQELLGKFPQDTQALLELGFFEVVQERPDAAIDAFERALRSGAQRADVFAQLGYLRLARGQTEDALKNFRAALELDPANEQVRMQTAYVLDSLGDEREAASIFNAIAAATTDPARRRDACRAAEVLAPLATRRLPRPFYSEIYTAPDYHSQIDVATLPLRLRAGVEFGETAHTEVYGQLAMLKDNRSGPTPPGPVIYFDNVLVLGGGITFRPTFAQGLALFADIGQAYDLIDQGRERWRYDARSGGEYFRTWAMMSRCPDDVTFPFRPVLEVYGASVYFTRYSNLISYARLRPGLRALESARTSIDVYLHLFGVFDTAGEVYNNEFEIGPGLMVTPDRHLSLRVGAEVVRRQFKDGSHDVSGRVRIEYAVRF
jgi:tetratricopeptide (TPR) repeat protein